MMDDDHLPLVVNSSYQQVWAAEAVKIELIMVHSITLKHDHHFPDVFRHCYSSQHNSYLLYAAILQRFEGGVLHSKLGN